MQTYRLIVLRPWWTRRSRPLVHGRGVAPPWKRIHDVAGDRISGNNWRCARSCHGRRAGVVRGRYHQRFGGVALPVPVEAIAEDLLGLVVDEAGDLDVSGMLVPAERRIHLNAAESPQRQRFTLAHEVGHWVCQVLAGHAAPVYCRAVDLLLEADRALEREANVFAAELLMPEPEVRASWAGLDRRVRKPLRRLRGGDRVEALQPRAGG